MAALGHEENRDDDIKVLSPPSLEELEADACPNTDIYFRAIPDMQTENASYTALENAYVDLKNKYNRLRKRVLDGTINMPTTRWQQQCVDSGVSLASHKLPDSVLHTLQKDELLKSDSDSPNTSMGTSSMDELMAIVQRLSRETATLKEIVHSQANTIRELQMTTVAKKGNVDRSRSYAFAASNDKCAPQNFKGLCQFQAPLQPPCSVTCRSHRGWSVGETCAARQGTTPAALERSPCDSPQPTSCSNYKYLDSLDDYSWITDFKALRDYTPTKVRMRCVQRDGEKEITTTATTSPDLYEAATVPPVHLRNITSTSGREVADGRTCHRQAALPADLFGGPIVQSDTLNEVCDVMREFTFCESDEPKTLTNSGTHAAAAESQSASGEKYCPVCHAIFEDSFEFADITRHVNAHFEREERERDFEVLNAADVREAMP